jgi:MinD superfamily P-loop ATPase
MKQITVLSGKGGTGKTTLVASFAALDQGLVVTDCDVDAPDLHLLLKPETLQKHKFMGSKLAVIDQSKCNQCGKCEQSCRFDAIHHLVVDPIFCEGCGVCGYVCPVGAVEFKERVSGYAFISHTKYGPMAHAILHPGEENSGKLVTVVRQNAERIAEERNYELILHDGPPGIGCPVIASVSGIDLGLIVVEPTLSGRHDMERAAALLKHFQIPALICINKYDINVENTQRIIEFCEAEDIVVTGKIPFDPLVTKAMIAGKPVIEHSPNSIVSKDIKAVWQRTINQLRAEPTTS